jgi:hypothetical protein
MERTTTNACLLKGFNLKILIALSLLTQLRLSQSGPPAFWFDMANGFPQAAQRMHYLFYLLLKMIDINPGKLQRNMQSLFLHLHA